MATLSERVKAVAQSLIVAVGATAAVSATDVRSAADRLQKDYAQYTVTDVRTRVANEIKQSHRPGISGSV